MTNSVTVMLSVTDQAVFLGEFMASLAAQRDVDVKMAVRVDREVASTKVEDVLRQFEPKGYEQGPVLGLPRTYLRLIGSVPLDSDFYAFADQDDLWDPDKLRIACESLVEVGESVPALWICGYVPVGGSRWKRRSTDGDVSMLEPSFSNALVENIAPGCTMVWNKPLQAILASRLPSSGVVMHDFWVYLVAATVGKILIEPEPLVDYRIHGDNATGIDRTLFPRLARFVGVAGGKNASIETQAAEFLTCMEDLLQPEQEELARVLAFGSSWARFGCALRKTYPRRSRLDQILLALRLLYPSRRILEAFHSPEQQCRRRFTRTDECAHRV